MQTTLYGTHLNKKFNNFKFKICNDMHVNHEQKKTSVTNKISALNFPAAGVLVNLFYTVAFAAAKSCLQWSKDNMCCAYTLWPVWKCTSLQDLGWRINGRTADCSRQQRRANDWPVLLTTLLFAAFFLFFILQETKNEKTAFIPPKNVKNLLKSSSLFALHSIWNVKKS